MRYVSTSDMRAIDAELLKTACHFAGVPDSDRLIKLAAQGLASLILEMQGNSGARPCIHVVFGKGNNGADAVHAGLELAERGFPVRHYAALKSEEAKGAVKSLLERGLLPDVVWFDEERPWTAMPASAISPGDVVLDGILGVGVKGAPREPAAAAIRLVNRLKGRAHVIAVDVPSGLDADAGTAAGEIVEADLTLCMGMPKIGMATPFALAHTGSIHVHDLAIPDAVLAADAEADGLVTARDVAGWLPRRRWDAHKGDFGHVCVVGGCARYRGAPALAAMGALRAGAGLVTAVVPEAIAGGVAAHAPEMMVLPLGSDVVTRPALEDSGFSFEGKTVVVGPGLSQRRGVMDAVAWLLEGCGVQAAVLDADALNVIGDEAEALASCETPMVLTPHPGEAARLLGCSAATVQADRAAALRRLVDVMRKPVVLKGAGTLVSAPGRGVHRVAGVNPGMASGGMGDVLAGVVGALLARGIDPFDAARAAAWLHARAGDVAAWRRGHEALLATDLLANL
ncbi:MAG: NAD(P)H-hydrate dehydratase [Kiritimatiellia bacterium]|jgi:hydroxyethylthiazole kinase-like uncharacterized protein yjeF